MSKKRNNGKLKNEIGKDKKYINDNYILQETFFYKTGNNYQHPKTVDEILDDSRFARSGFEYV